jgi:ERO1-like protein alpha
MICNFHTCSVCQCDDEEIPLPWMQDSENDGVDKSIGEQFHRWVEKYNYSSPHWLVENEIDSRNGIFVNLEKNPEGFTGYQGQHIWNAIYYENCFKGDLLNYDQLCKEEKTFFKIISGLHSNINIHLSKNYLDMNKNISFSNHSMMVERVLKYPDRVNNLFFLYSLLLKAFYKGENLIKNFHIYTGNEKEDNRTLNYLQELYTLDNDTILTKGREICEECLNRELSINTENFDKFLNFKATKLDELKMRFRNISQIIDCVSCQKCKLHGKLQIYGLATMLKILFVKNDESFLRNLKLKRNEVISFVNLVGKVSKSIKHFKEFYKEDYLKYLFDSKNSYEKFVTNSNTFFCLALMFLLGLVNRYYLKNPEKLQPKISKKK